MKSEAKRQAEKANLWDIDVQCRYFRTYGALLTPQSFVVARRAPTDLDKTFLATSSNIEDDVFVEKELEEIQSQLQERAAKVIHNTGSSFTRFTSGLRMADSDPSESSLIKKVSPRRPSVNSLTGYNITDFSDVASENSDISSSRLNFPPPAPILTVETAAQR